VEILGQNKLLGGAHIIVINIFRHLPCPWPMVQGITGEDGNYKQFGLSQDGAGKMY